MDRMEQRNGNLQRAAKQAAEVVRRRRTWCCPHCGYQGHRNPCPRCANPCDPLPSRRKQP